VVQRINNQFQVQRRGLAGVGVFLIVTGLIMSAWGFYTSHTFDFTVALGFCFIVSGLFTIRGRPK
jgi:uncharacterized membrane protein HdeD (DUF308 family)